MIAENKIKTDVTKKLEESDQGQTADEVAERSIAGLEKGEELVTTTLMTRGGDDERAGGGGGIRNGWVVLDTVLSWVMGLVVVVIRWDMDATVRKWGRENGTSGMKK